jgi:serine/threonine protein phosphatase PrpC
VSRITHRLFGRPKPEKSDELTRPLSRATPTVASPAPVVRTSEPPQLLAGCAQSIGLQRNHNEDGLFMLTSTLVSNKSVVPFGLYIVADGMGGHRHGEVASGTAVRVMASYVIRRLFTPVINSNAEAQVGFIQEILRQGVLDAHRVILKDAPGGGTTLTAVLILGDQLSIAHVGDSRAYTISAKGELQALTNDHSLVRRLEELGQITAEEAAVHPQRNVLYRALGQGEPFDPDVNTSDIPKNGYLLLCSDGLWGVVPEETIQRLVLSCSMPEQACQEMIDAANAAGGPDNITAILVRMPVQTD